MCPEVRPVQLLLLRRRVDTLCVLPLLLLLLLLLHSVAAAAASERDADSERSEQSLLGSRLDHVESYELTHPRWIHPRVRNTRSSRQQFPSKTEVVITAEGQQLRLHLEQNEQLLAPGYQEIWYTPAGSRRSSTPGHT
ncbi:hypothetical protein CRUP_009878, partial [Coryphaenoides rupestris]